MTGHSEKKPRSGQDTPPYEVRDANLSNLLRTGAGLFGLVIFSLLLSWGLYSHFLRHSAAPGEEPETFTVPDGIPPSPRLQQDPHTDLLIMRRGEDSILTSYGWVNKDSGFARIPVDRALEILATRGLPARGDGDGNLHEQERR